MSNTEIIDTIGAGSMWIVRRNGVQVDTASHFDAAERKADSLRRKSKQRQRFCLCCDKEFTSWGIGNRMCPTCRLGETD